MDFKSWTFNLEELNDFMDIVKDSVVKKMVDENIIDLNKYEDFVATHTMIIKDSSKVSNFIRKLFKIKSGSNYVLCAQITDVRTFENVTEDPRKVKQSEVTENLGTSGSSGSAVPEN